nr:putative mediator of RNA polymerase II transcription subunit 26 isoform X2 [Halyomorpha halys]
MPSNICTVFRGRNESSPRRNFPMMHVITLALILLSSTCLADEKRSYNDAEISKQAEENIRWLRHAKEEVERRERERNSLATLTDIMIKDSFDSQLMSKMDILYDNQTDLSRELKFVPQVFNCGKEFDIFKVLELAKAHRNVTTEQPPCILDVDENMCTTKKAAASNKNIKVMKNTVVPQMKDLPVAVHGYPVQALVSTKAPSGLPALKKTPSSALKLPAANPQTKNAKLKVQNKEKSSQVEKDMGGKVVSSHLQKQFEPQGMISKTAAPYRIGVEPSLDDVRGGENPLISDDLLNRWYSDHFEESEPQPYSSFVNQVSLHEPQVSKQEAASESLQQEQRGQSPMIQKLPEQAKAVEPMSSSEEVAQTQLEDMAMDGKGFQNQPALKPTIEQGKQQAGEISIISDQKKQNLNQKGFIIKHQVNKQAKEAPPLQQSLNQQFSELQKRFNEQQSQHLGKQNQQQPQLSGRQNQQQPQLSEKQNQQQSQIAEQRNQQEQQTNQQQPQTAEQGKQQQLQIAEQGNQQQQQTAEQDKQQQLQIAEQGNQQQQQTAEQHNQQTAEQGKQQQQQIAEQGNQQQQQTAEQGKQQQLQIAEQGNQQQQQTAEQHNQQQQQTAEQRNQQQQQTAEQGNQQQQQTEERRYQQQQQTEERRYQQQQQTSEQQKRQQFLTMGKINPQLQGSEEKNQPQIQSIRKQSPTIISRVVESKRQQSAIPVLEQQPLPSHSASDQRQTLFPLRIEQKQHEAKLVTNPTIGSSAQQAAQLPETQSVAKLQTEAPNKGFPENSGEKLSNSNTDKNMMSAPINAMVMEPNLNSSNKNPSSKFNLAPANIPGTVYFWGNTMTQTSKMQNYGSMKPERNKAASIANRLESSDMPGNIQENSKGDYFYYQEQD